MHLDRTDFEILCLLRNNARLSNKELANSVGIAQSTCLTRIRNLLVSNVIQGFHADVNPNALGLGLQAMITVRLRHHEQEKLEAFQSHILALPEVMQLYHIAGQHDYQAHVWAVDTDHLRDLAMTQFTARAEVEHIETVLIFEHAVSTVLPVPIELAETDGGNQE